MQLNALDVGSASPVSKDAAPLATSANAEPTGTLSGFGQVMAQTQLAASADAKPADSASAEDPELAQELLAADPNTTPNGSTSPMDQSMVPIFQQLAPAGIDLAQSGTALPLLQDHPGAVHAHPANTSDQLEVTPTKEAPVQPPWALGWPVGQVVEQIHVGPSLQAITAKDATPDHASLAAFARSQGLDAHAIAWLLGPSAEANQALPSSASGPGTSSLEVLQSFVTSTTTGTTLSTTAPISPPSAAFSAAANTAAIGDSLPSRCATVSTSVMAMISATARTLAASEQQAELASPVDSTGDELTLLSAQSNSLAFNRLRRLQLEPATTFLPNHRSGNTVQDPAWRESELDLSSFLQPDVQSATEPPASPGSDTPMLASSSSNISKEVPGLTLHTASVAAADDKVTASAQALGNRASSDQMQQLADQMADAIGERLVREFERGHWNLRLMLKPAHLGHIEVEMRMRSGELDASFIVPHAGTRELLQDGLARLKENLGQMGMDVAFLDVKTGQNRQNGGDSTAKPKLTAETTLNSETTEMQAQPTQAFIPRPRHADGWDVMV